MIKDLFAPVAGAPKAKILAVLKGFVMAFNTSDATYGDSPDRWWCSAYPSCGFRSMSTGYGTAATKCCTVFTMAPRTTY